MNLREMFGFNPENKYPEFKLGPEYDPAHGIKIFEQLGLEVDPNFEVPERNK